jgi:hypothetical protein
MRKCVLLIGAIVLCFCQPRYSLAQGNNAPKVLTILREEIKPGRSSAHARLEAGYVRALQKVKWPVYSLAMTPAVGGTDAWFISGYDSFAALEKDRDAISRNAELSREFDRLDALDAEFRTSQRNIVASLNEELSYKTKVDLPLIRYMSVTTLRVRIGHNSDYFEARRILVDAYKKANADLHSVLFAVTAGEPIGTFLLIVPLKSLAELDPNPQAKAIDEAMGEENSQRRRKLLAESVESIETVIYEFSPRMSYVSDEFAKAGGAFWTPKPLATANTAAPKRPPATAPEKKPAAPKKPAATAPEKKP